MPQLAVNQLRRKPQCDMKYNNPFLKVTSRGNTKKDPY